MQNQEHVKSLLINTYEGKTWYGKNITNTLHDAPVGQALLRLNGSYNIAELVSHMIAWRKYAIHLLEQGVHRHVPEQINFPTIEVMMMEDWQELLDTFNETQRQLVALLSAEHLDLNKEVAGKPYTFGQVLEGVAHHDIYHAGQINLLAKFL